MSKKPTKGDERKKVRRTIPLSEIEYLKLENLELKRSTLQKDLAVVEQQRKQLAASVSQRHGIDLKDYVVNGPFLVLNRELKPDEVEAEEPLPGLPKPTLVPDAAPAVPPAQK